MRILKLKNLTTEINEFCIKEIQIINLIFFNLNKLFDSVDLNFIQFYKIDIKEINSKKKFKIIIF